MWSLILEAKHVLTSCVSHDKSIENDRTYITILLKPFYVNRHFKAFIATKNFAVISVSKPISLHNLYFLANNNTNMAVLSVYCLIVEKQRRDFRKGKVRAIHNRIEPQYLPKRTKNRRSWKQNCLQITNMAIKVNVKLSLCFELSKTPGRRTGGCRYSSIHSLTSALDGGEWSALPTGKEPLIPTG
jgi:hypothetical protein